MNSGSSWLVLVAVKSHPKVGREFARKILVVAVELFMS
jgi:hypothetical protein